MKKDANAQWAIAFTLEHYGHHQEAQRHAKEGLKGATGVKRFQTLELLARILLSRHQLKNSYSSINECLADRTVTPKLLRQALVTRAKVEVAIKKYDDAISSYQEARHTDDDTPMSGDHLQAAFEVCSRHKSDSDLIALVRDWKPLEKLAWMTWGLEDSDEQHCEFRPAAGRTGEQDFMIQAYTEVIILLDKVNAGAPMRLELALGHWLVCGDLDAAKKLVYEILDSECDGYDFAFTNVDPAGVLVQAIALATDLAYEQYRATADPVVKALLFAELKAIKDRTFVRSINMNESQYAHYDSVLARMARKMASSQEFQACLDRAFRRCYDGLRDTVGWNDWDNMTKLAQVISQLDGLETEAKILLSAQFSELDTSESAQKTGEASQNTSDTEDSSDESTPNTDTEDEEPLAEDEGDLAGNDVVCDGECKQTVSWRSWKGRSLYQCTICFDTCLCEDCYAKRMSYNTGTKCTFGSLYCGLNHKYVKAPIEGWKGITKGVMTVDGREPVKFKDWLEDLNNNKWPAAWKRFWLAND